MALIPKAGTAGSSVVANPNEPGYSTSEAKLQEIQLKALYNIQAFESQLIERAKQNLANSTE